MQYTITITGETKKEIGDYLYIFPEYHSEKITLESASLYCRYQEKVIDAIRPKLHQNVNWNGAIIFEYMCGTDAYYSNDIAISFKSGSYRRVYYNKEDAEKEMAQRIENINKKIQSFASTISN